MNATGKLTRLRRVGVWKVFPHDPTFAGLVILSFPTLLVLTKNQEQPRNLFRFPPKHTGQDPRKKKKAFF